MHVDKEGAEKEKATESNPSPTTVVVPTSEHAETPKEEEPPKEDTAPAESSGASSTMGGFQFSATTGASNKMSDGFQFLAKSRVEFSAFSRIPSCSAPTGDGFVFQGSKMNQPVDATIDRGINDAHETGGAGERTGEGGSTSIDNAPKQAAVEPEEDLVKLEGEEELKVAVAVEAKEKRSGDVDPIDDAPKAEDVADLENEEIEGIKGAGDDGDLEAAGAQEELEAEADGVDPAPRRSSRRNLGQGVHRYGYDH